MPVNLMSIKNQTFSSLDISNGFYSNKNKNLQKFDFLVTILIAQNHPRAHFFDYSKYIRRARPCRQL